MLFHRPAVHSVYALCYLAKHPPDQVVPANRIAETMNVPSEQAAKLLQTLNAVGFVHATRGRSGGYRLAKPLAEISVLELIDAVASSDDEDALQPRECPLKESRECTAHHGMVALNDKVRKLLASETVAGLLGKTCKLEDHVKRPPTKLTTRRGRVKSGV